MSNTRNDEGDIFDFGFTAIGEDELEPIQTYAAKEADVTQRLHEMYASILPLLENLKSNPDKDYIYWPNRTSKIDSFLEKLNKIRNGK